MNVMTGQVQADQTLKDNAPSGKCAGQEDQQTGGCASIGDHVQNGSKLCGLLEFSGGHAVKCI